eukprot:TRINITY_DN7713_c1_g2_i1.p1 TRINITY_DN7713_c1_g2~~TRINITY_DN7713_c1_g2_i1.p1  ORF type:complete len:270 (+),score=56.25 TRINITY_DN7713_c1_g2_i1:58-867(+)
MACGFGVAAVRALSEKVPKFSFKRHLTRPDSKKLGSGSKASKYDAEGAADEVRPNEERTLTTFTFESMESGLPEGFHNRTFDNQDVSDSDSELDDSISVRNHLASPTRTLSGLDLPDSSEFLNEAQMDAYKQIYLSADMDAGEDDDCASVRNRLASPTRSLTSLDLPGSSEFLGAEQAEALSQMYRAADMDASAELDSESENGDASAESDSDSESGENVIESTAGDESDCEDMYRGPLQPQRTTVRTDFPAPTEYLTYAELVDLWKDFE